MRRALELYYKENPPIDLSDSAINKMVEWAEGIGRDKILDGMRLELKRANDLLERTNGRKKEPIKERL